MPSHKISMKHETALKIADEFLLDIHRHSYATVAGSVRRMREICHDIDIVFQPLDDLSALVKSTCERLAGVKIVRWGPKLAAVLYAWQGREIPIDLYFTTPATLPTLLLIRTGSKDFNIRMCRRAQAQGLKLHASGDGLFNAHGELLANESEAAIFAALGEPYREPWERER